LEAGAVEGLVNGGHGEANLHGKSLDLEFREVKTVQDLDLAFRQFAQTALQRAAFCFKLRGVFLDGFTEKQGEVVAEGETVPGFVPAECEDLHPGYAKGPTSEAEGVHPRLEFFPEGKCDLLGGFHGFLPAKQEGSQIDAEAVLNFHVEAEKFSVVFRTGGFRGRGECHARGMHRPARDLDKKTRETFLSRFVVMKR
jgi:hypothetical protein